MNPDDTNPEPAETPSRLSALAVRLYPAAEFGLRVAALAGVAAAVGVGLAAADLSTAVGTLAGNGNTTCCIIIPPH
jgi:hypothetical protein